MRGARLPVYGLGLSAIAFALGVLQLRARHELGWPANDVYAFFYPNIVYAWRSVQEGTGLLWNPYQSCGHPFFAGSVQVGLLYPVNLLFAVLDREPALLGSVMVNLTVAGVGTYLLGRALGLGATGALCSALAFQLGGWTVHLAGWSPIHLASYAWLPAAMWRTERLIRAPTVRNAAFLGTVLTVQLLPGFPQTSLFTYQAVVFRIAWAVLARQAPRPGAVLAAAVVGIALPAVLGAALLLPAGVVARESVRTIPLPPADIARAASWAGLWQGLLVYWSAPGNLVALLLGGAAVIAAWRRSTPAPVWFWVVLGMLSFLLSLGRGTPLWEAYAHLPLAASFRDVGRLGWVTTFAIAVLAGVGVDALLRRPERATAVALGTLAAAAGLVGILLSPPSAAGAQGRGPAAADWGLAAVVLALVIGAPGSRFTHLAFPVVLLVGGIAFGPQPIFNLRSGDLYGASAPALAFVRERMTPQDRVVLQGRYGASPDYALVQKAASLAHLPNIYDYEPLVSRAYAEYFAFMRTGGQFRIDDWNWAFDRVLPPTVQRPLLDLTAARYIIVDRALDTVAATLGSGIRLLAEIGYMRVYENMQASSRTFYAPRLTVMPTSHILSALADGSVDARATVVVDKAPTSGFTGGAPGATGVADIIRDEGEHLAVRVRATAPGVLFVADQYATGWEARVNGRPEEILRAAHTFRAVLVPVGESTVTFDYRPWSVPLGLVVSLVGSVLVVGVCVRRRV